MGYGTDKNSKRYGKSVLDRLIDLEPRVEHDPPEAEEVDLAHYLASVRRDLQLLLNTRQYLGDDELKGYDEASQSLLTYGFPDLTSAMVPNSETLARLARSIENSVRKFEPRIVRIHVSPGDIRPASPGIQFRVDATVFAEPYTERVVFDTVLDLDRSEHKIGELQ